MADPTSIDQQTAFWNHWNTTAREHETNPACQRQAETALKWLADVGDRRLNILEVGCGTVWLCPRLADFGSVVGTDLSDLDKAKAKWPSIDFVSGDFMNLDFDETRFDVIVTLETLAHVADQPAFVRKLARHLKPGGKLIMSTQNGPVIRRWGHVAAQGVGQLRNWTDRKQLSALLARHFAIEEMTTVAPVANRGLMRYVNSSKLNAPVRAIAGDRLDRLKERLGLGWAIMALAHLKE